MKKEKKNLTERQEIFCVAYATNPNATEAAKKAGYKNPGSYGSENLKKPEIQARLAELTKDRRKRDIADMLEAQESLTAIARRLETEEFYLPDGTEVSKKAAIRDALKAWELLGKMQGAFLDRSQVEVSGAIPVVIKDDI